LDWDGFSHMSALEQNFNPDGEDIKRREQLGKVFGGWVYLFIFSYFRLLRLSTPALGRPQRPHQSVRETSDQPVSRRRQGQSME